MGRGLISMKPSRSLAGFVLEPIYFTLYCGIIVNSAKEAARSGTTKPELQSTRRVEGMRVLQDD